VLLAGERRTRVSSTHDGSGLFLATFCKDGQNDRRHGSPRHDHGTFEKEICLNTRRTILTCWALLALGVPLSAAWAGPPVGPAALVAASAVGQASPQGDPKREAADLLARARKAIGDGQFDLAESLIGQAEAKNVSYGMLNLLDDTPKKVRAELDRAKSSQQGGGSSGLSRLVPGILRSEPAKPATDPFSVAPPASGAPSMTARADVPAGFPAPGPHGPAGSVEVRRLPPSPEQAAQARGRSDALLIGARKALAGGDVRRAASLADEASRLSVAYGDRDDSPSRVQADIAKYEAMQQYRAANGASETYYRQYGQFLLEQAECMVRWNQFDEAENLARGAENLRVQYLPFERNPKAILALVGEKRQAARAAAQGAGGVVAAGFAGGPGGVQNAAYDAKRHATDLCAQARAAMAAGDLAGAEAFIAQAEGLRVPQYAFALGEDHPGLVRADIQRMRAAGGPLGTGVQRVQGRGELPVPAGAVGQLKDEAERALQAGQTDRARQLFLQLEQQFGDKLSAADREFVRGRLQYLGRTAPGALDVAAQQNEVLRKQLSANLAESTRQARTVSQRDPDQAMSVLQEARTAVERSSLDAASKQQLLMRADGEIDSLRRYIAQNAPRIKLDQQNRQVLDENERQRRNKIEIDSRLARMVEDYNRALDRQDYEQADLVARQCAELAPDALVVVNMRHQSRVLRRLFEQYGIRDQSAAGFDAAITSIDEAKIPFDDRNPIRFGDGWAELTKRRRGLKFESRRSPKEIEIEQKLLTPVSLHFRDTALVEVIDHLKRVAKINLHVDVTALAEAGVDPRTPVTIELQDDISLKSALQLILDELGLSYVIKDEVLKITTSEHKDSEVYVETYNVADLVIPIPNFLPSAHMGMQGAIDAAYRQAGSYGFGAPVTAVATADGGTGNAKIDPTVLANLSSYGASAPPFGGPPAPLGAGPGGLGGFGQPDFDSLIELITTTVAPSSWEDAGGPGSIKEFETNLTLVVSNTRDVHDQIADLLEQLRRLQDLQVTIEVRFITLNDNFFERIGVDFDFDIDDDIDRPFGVFGQANFDTAPNSTSGTDVPAFDHQRSLQDRDHGPGVTVGLERGSTFRADLDIPFRNGSFPLAIPQFGGYQVGAGAELGFAILSDLEAFFFIEASQGDRRSNVLQAPKVTLFNGQSAIVSDTSQSPFVISVIPVVGDFAAALQPVVAVLSEGTFLNVQAVVSNDRRFVRLTMVPFFSTIGDVNTFTFNGSEQTIDDSPNDVDGDGIEETPARRRQSREGTTVQLPTFSFISIVTTVSVPDGGTVLLGGIKRLSEGRNEFGVPILNKVPYVQRLFSNVAIGRETQSLMMMVTPRIIIQEEEEQLLGINTAP
jgi:general secretion pathway protein D